MDDSLLFVGGLLLPRFDRVEPFPGHVDGIGQLLAGDPSFAATLTDGKAEVYQHNQAFLLGQDKRIPMAASVRATSRQHAREKVDDRTVTGRLDAPAELCDGP